MTRFIQELFYGNISPQTRGFKQGSSVQRAQKRLSDNEEVLTNKLTGEEKRLFLEYVNAWGEVNGADCLDNFILGFRLGAGLTYDAFVSDESPLENYVK